MYADAGSLQPTTLTFEDVDALHRVFERESRNLMVQQVAATIELGMLVVCDLEHYTDMENQEKLALLLKRVYELAELMALWRKILSPKEGE